MKRLKHLGVTTPLALLAYIIITVVESNSAQAQSVLGACPGQTGLNVLPDVYCNATLGWLSRGLGIAQGFFVILVGIEFAWSAILWVFQKENFGELLGALVVKVMGISFFYFLLMSGVARWLPGIMQDFVNLGQSVTQVSINLNDPQSIFFIGINVCNAVFANLPQPHFYFNFFNLGSTIQDDLTIAFCMLVAVIFASIICLVLFIAFLIAAAQLIMTLIETYIMISAGVVFLGFTGSRWTMSFGEKWISYAFSIGVKLFVTYVIIALGASLFPSGVPGAPVCDGNQGQQICNDIMNVHNINFYGAGDINNLGTVVVDYLIIGASAVIFMMLMMRLPGLAASMLNGSPSLTAGAMIQAFQSVGSAVAGAASAVVSTATTVGTEGALAVKDAAMLAAGAAGGGGGAGGAGGAGASGAAGADAGAAAGGADAAGAADVASAGDAASSSSSPSNPAASSKSASSSNPSNGVPVVGHLANAAIAPIGGTLSAASSAISPLQQFDEGGNGGSVSIGLRMS